MVLPALDRDTVLALVLRTTPVAARFLAPANIGTLVVGGALFVNGVAWSAARALSFATGRARASRLRVEPAP